MTFEVRSTAFEEGEMIPPQYTCDGENISPPFVWESIPDGTESLALLLEDIDSVEGIWSHWIVFNIPANVKTLAEALPPKASFLWGGEQGRNDFDALGYGGPCPSDGKTHRYVARLYALDTPLGLNPGATREDVLAEIDGHIIESAELMARYMRLSDR